MKKLLAIAASTLMLVAQQAHAVGTSPAVVYSNLLWNISSNAAPFSACNQMLLDGTGNLNTTNKFVAYGALNCAGGVGLATTGTGYIGVNGSFNMTLTASGGSQLVCGNLSSNTLSGICAVVNSSGYQIGTALISYQP